MLLYNVSAVYFLCLSSLFGIIFLCAIDNVLTSLLYVVLASQANVQASHAVG